MNLANRRSIRDTPAKERNKQAKRKRKLFTILQNFLWFTNKVISPSFLSCLRCLVNDKISARMKSTTIIIILHWFQEVFYDDKVCVLRRFYEISAKSTATDSKAILR